MTKKRALFLSVCGAIIFSVAITISVKGLCLINLICSRSHDDSVAFVFFPTITLFIFSLITYPMQDKIFQSWWRFARIWVPLSMLVILISPSYSHNFIFPIEKGTVAFFSSALFVIISLVQIILTSRKLKKNK